MVSLLTLSLGNFFKKRLCSPYILTLRAALRRMTQLEKPKNLDPSYSCLSILGLFPPVFPQATIRTCRKMGLDSSADSTSIHSTYEILVHSFHCKLSSSLWKKADDKLLNKVAAKPLYDLIYPLYFLSRIVKAVVFEWTLLNKLYNFCFCTKLNKFVSFFSRSNAVNRSIGTLSAKYPLALVHRHLLFSQRLGPFQSNYTACF